MYISTKTILLQREEVRTNYRPTYRILLPRGRERERESKQLQKKSLVTERREVRTNYRPTYLILLPRERERERDRANHL